MVKHGPTEKKTRKEAAVGYFNWNPSAARDGVRKGSVTTGQTMQWHVYSWVPAEWK